MLNRGNDNHSNNSGESSNCRTFAAAIDVGYTTTTFDDSSSSIPSSVLSPQKLSSSFTSIRAKAQYLLSSSKLLQLSSWSWLQAPFQGCEDIQDDVNEQQPRQLGVADEERRPMLKEEGTTTAQSIHFVPSFNDVRQYSTSAFTLASMDSTTSKTTKHVRLRRYPIIFFIIIVVQGFLVGHIMLFQTSSTTDDDNDSSLLWLKQQHQTRRTTKHQSSSSSMRSKALISQCHQFKSYIKLFQTKENELQQHLRLVYYYDHNYKISTINNKTDFHKVQLLNEPCREENIHNFFINEVTTWNEPRAIKQLSTEYNSMDDSDPTMKMPKEVVWKSLDSKTKEQLYYDILDDDDNMNFDYLQKQNHEEQVTIKEDENTTLLEKTANNYKNVGPVPSWKIAGIGYFKPPPDVFSEGGDEELQPQQQQCQPMADWQTESYINCNTFHEMNMMDDYEKFINHGEYRDVWKITIQNNIREVKDPSLVLKTLRMNEGFFTAHRAEQHRIDAVASERLTSSKYVANIYGFCGQSAINEMAKPTGRFVVRGTKQKLNNHKRITYALDVAKGIAAAHGIETTTFKNNTGMVSLVHRDIRSSNFLFKGGHNMILHDFNCARFMWWSPPSSSSNNKKGYECGFYKHECSHDRSPEECWGQMLSSKVDIYAMGNVFYTIITGYTPYTYPKKLSLEEASYKAKYGITSQIPPYVLNSPNEAIQGIIRIIQRCWSYHPKDRPDAVEVVNELQKIYNNVYGEEEES